MAPLFAGQVLLNVVVALDAVGGELDLDGLHLAEDDLTFSAWLKVITHCGTKAGVQGLVFSDQFLDAGGDLGHFVLSGLTCDGVILIRRHLKVHS